MSGDVVTSAEEADRALVWTRLASHPWGFRSREKILAIIERGTTAADLDAWERESQRPNRGQPWAMSKIQEFARPTDIPRLTKKPPTGDGW